VRHKEIFQVLGSINMSLIGSWGQSDERVEGEGVPFPPNFDARNVGALDWQFEYFAVSLSVQPKFQGLLIKIKAYEDSAGGFDLESC